MRPNKNHRSIKSVFKTFIDVMHFQRSGKGKIARDATGLKADERSESYVKSKDPKPLLPALTLDSRTVAAF